LLKTIRRIEMKAPTQAQIKKEIATLKKYKPRIREVNGLGDNNHEAIDAQIEVLDEDLDDDAIWERWPEEKKDMRIRMAAEEARNWMDDGLDPPSKSWKELVR
jgi:hypothetical protein